MEGKWYSRAYRPSGKDDEPLPGRLETEGTEMILPPLEQAEIGEGIWLLPEGKQEVSEITACRWLPVKVPFVKKKGFLQWAMRVLLGRLFAGGEEKERFWWAKWPGKEGTYPLASGGVLTKNGLLGQGIFLPEEERELLACPEYVSAESGEIKMKKISCTVKEEPVFVPDDRDMCHMQEASDPRQTEPEPDFTSAAIGQFRALYTDPKKRKQKKLWMDYFMGPDFFRVWREPSFTGAMLAVVREAGEGELSGGPAGVQWLPYLEF